MSKQKHKTREEWLLSAIQELRKYFSSFGYNIPNKVKVSCGFPCGNKRKVTGQAWSANASKGKFFEIFISPILDNDVATKDGVLSTLVHELIHITVGNKCGHRKAFKRAAKELGLEGKLTQSIANKDLCKFLKTVANTLGQFSHRAIVITKKTAKTQPTRLIKVGCTKCNYIVRVTRLHLDDKGAPLCPIHKKAFVEM